jgi:hypothetical protein
MSEVSKKAGREGVIALTRQTRRCPKCGSTKMRATKPALVSPPPNDELDPVLFECPGCAHTKVMDRRSKRTLFGLAIAFVIMMSICISGLVSGDKQLFLGGGAFSALVVVCLSDFFIVQLRYPVTGKVAPGEEVDILIPEKGLYAAQLANRRCRKCQQPTMEAVGADQAGWGKNENYRCKQCGHEHVVVKVGGVNLACFTFLLLVGAIFFFADSPDIIVYGTWAMFFIGLLLWFNADDWFLYPEVLGDKVESAE